MPTHHHQVVFIGMFGRRKKTGNQVVALFQFSIFGGISFQYEVFRFIQSEEMSSLKISCFPRNNTEAFPVYRVENRRL
ncbi:hypothetical protein HOV93_11140 [Planctomycetes bacterium FF15]|uniref:Uncharacterized protein n=1 Tax=Bremerella alba TaxID=980252 RepID=A0A7V9A6H5_9BACT|nr:hypothetical protein [Bremerella alba]